MELYNIDLAWCHQWIKSSRIFWTLFEYQCVGRFPTYFIVLRSLLALWQKSAIDMSDNANVSGYLRLSCNWLKHKCFFDVLTLQARYLSWIEPALFFAEPGWWEFKSIAGVLYMSSAGTFVEILNWHTASRNIMLIFLHWQKPLGRLINIWYIWYLNIWYMWYHVLCELHSFMLVFLKSVITIPIDFYIFGIGRLSLKSSWQGG